MNVLRAPFLFLFIRFRGKWIYTFVLPVIGGAVITLLVTLLSGSVPVLGNSGLFSKLLAVMPIAGGFFVAALTVILSQSNSVLQAGFTGAEKPYLSSDGEPMSRQRFLALLFGYLSFSSFTIAALVAGIDLMAPAIRSAVKIEYWSLLRTLTTFWVMFWSFQMFFCSLIGLFYLTDRLYRSSGVASFKRDLPK